MSTAKGEVKALLDRLPGDCSLEDIQYHLLRDRESPTRVGSRGR